MTVIYLHGFASSAKSTKARFFAERLAEYAIDLRTPDLNGPDFSTLTITRMLGQVADEIASAGSEPAVLMGSSLGGALAVLAADKFKDRVGRVVLMAPAVMFAKPGHHLLPPERIEEWRWRGSMPFFHYAENKERLLNFSFYEDSRLYDPFDAVFPQPALLFQGRHDVSVDPQMVEAFASTRSNVSLTMLDDDHQLIASLPRMWNDTARFLGLSK